MKPPVRPAKKTRDTTGVVVSVGCDHVAVCVELQDPADQLGVELAAEQGALHLDADRGDADDRELALLEQAEVDLDALDRAGERQPAEALDAGDARRQGQREVGRVGLDVRAR